MTFVVRSGTAQQKNSPECEGDVSPPHEPPTEGHIEPVKDLIINIKFVGNSYEETICVINSGAAQGKPSRGGEQHVGPHEPR